MLFNRLTQLSYTSAHGNMILLSLSSGKNKILCSKDLQEKFLQRQTEINF